MDTTGDEDDNPIGGFIQNGWINTTRSMAHKLLMPSTSGVLLSSTVLVCGMDTMEDADICGTRFKTATVSCWRSVQHLPF